MTVTVRPVRRDDHLRAAYRACRRAQRRLDPTSYCATSLLPAPVRPATHALYGYVRGADEIVDGPRRAALPDQRRAALDAWHCELRRGVAAGGSEHPVIAALVDAGARHDLPLGELDVNIASMRVDCAPVRMRDDAELDRYMRGSAGAVGVIMARLLGAEDEALARLGAAFQLTNFIRDVREDWALDRVYLPGLDEDDLRARRASDAFRERVAGEVARARALFRETAGAARGAGPRFARHMYLRTLDRVERRDYDVL